MVKTALYAAALGATGLGMHAFFLGLENRRWIAGLTLAFAIAVASRLLLLNAELGGGFQYIFDFSMFGWIWAPNQAQALAYAGGATALLTGALLRIPALFLIGAGAVFAGTGLGGHTQGLEAPAIDPFLVSLHVAIAAFWVTAPFVLWPRGELPDNLVLHRMRKFSQIAAWSVPVLFASGIWLALRLSGSFGALVSETYGRLLLMKLLLACGALALGALNKFRVTEYLEKKSEHGRMFLRRTLIMDCVLFAGGILMIAAATTLTGPGT